MQFIENKKLTGIALCGTRLARNRAGFMTGVPVGFHFYAMIALNQSKTFM